MIAKQQLKKKTKEMGQKAIKDTDKMFEEASQRLEQKYEEMRLRQGLPPDDREQE